MKRLILCLFLCLVVLTGCQRSKTYTRSNVALDTVVSITLYNNGSEEILDETFNIINNYDILLDSYNLNSILRSANTEKVKLPDELFDLINKNIEFYNLTDGLFSPTLGNLIELWGINEPIVKEPPSIEEIQEALNHIDINNLELDTTEGTIYVTDSEEIINLGASSKGYIADQLKEYLIEQGVDSALINLGGNIQLIGSKENRDFVIGIDNPDLSETEPIATIEVNNKSIVTSGNYQRYFTDSEGNRYHHILDPTTGYPAETDLKEVVVISDSSLEGDILSTSLFIMGKEKAIDFLEDYNNQDLEVILICKDNSIYITKNLENNFTLEPDFKNIYNVDYF